MTVDRFREFCCLAGVDKLVNNAARHTYSHARHNKGSCE
jgi:hypothetical protein